MVVPTNARTAPVFGLLMTVGILLSACAVNSVHVAKEDIEFSPGPAIWTVKDKDTTVHIFGAVEVVPPETAWRSEEFKVVFASAEAIIFETDPRPEAQAAIGPIVQQLGIYRNGRTLRGALNDDQESELAEVAASLGVPLAALDSLKPWLASLQLGSLNAQKQGYTGWINIFSEIDADASAAGKEIRFLEETRAVLLQAISDLPEETHVKMLVTTARQIKNNPEPASEAAAVWLDGDVKRLEELFHGPGQWADDVVYDALVVKRNQKWVQDIEATMANKKGVYLYVIGTGHVLGEDSMIMMLDDKRFPVDRY